MLLPLLASLLGARAAADVSGVEALIARARAERLSGDTAWIRLGHWRRTLGGGWKSEADGADFFLASEGKSDPARELEATLRAIFGLVPLSADQTARGVLPAFCRFPARAAWLVGKLGIDPARLPAQRCQRLEEYWARVAPESVSLVFSSYYLNNPASAFGHTFLRIRKRDQDVPRERRELLDSGIDFSATADTGNPLLYAFKGLTGLFPGSFHLFPYYYKVREYNDYESRDIWEYELALSGAQLAMLAAHIFELGSTYFDYYYVDENCSYHVLTALEAAAPELRLLDHVRVPVMPADTVKALFANPGLVRGIRYRPSAMTQFRARVEGMDAEQLTVVEGLAADPAAPLPRGLATPERIRVLDAAADLIDVRHAQELLVEAEGPGANLKQRLLARRAKLLLPSPELSVALPSREQPHAGHGSGRFSTAVGYSSGRGPLLSLGYRLALHALDDPPAGYPELSQIEFFPASLRFYPRDQSVELESIDLVNVLSLHPVSRFDQRLSWRVRAGARRERDGGCDGCLVGALALGSGFTMAAARESVAFFLFADVELQGSPALRGIERLPALRIGVGPSGGLRVRMGERLTWMGAAQWRWLPAAFATTTWALESKLRWEMGPGAAVGLDARGQPGGSEGALQLYFFF